MRILLHQKTSCWQHVGVPCNCRAPGERLLCLGCMEERESVDKRSTPGFSVLSLSSRQPNRVVPFLSTCSLRAPQQPDSHFVLQCCLCFMGTGFPCSHNFATLQYSKDQLGGDQFSGGQFFEVLTND